MFGELAKIKLTADDFGHDLELRTYLLLHDMWLKGRQFEVVNIFHRMRSERFEVDNRAVWLVDLWLWLWWPEDLGKWYEPEDDRHNISVACGLAAARKVRWLAARRHAIHRARQAIRDAGDGVSSPEEYDEYE